MAKKQTRRSISVRGTTYEALRAHCAEASLSMSDFIEQRIAEYFEQSGAAPVPTKAEKVAAEAEPPAKVKKAQPAKAEPVAAKTVTEKTTAQPGKTEKKSEAKKAGESARIPSASAIHKPSALAARRSSAPTVTQEATAPNGRPGPTPAAEVIKPRPKYDEAGDYRGIRF